VTVRAIDKKMNYPVLGISRDGFVQYIADGEYWCDLPYGFIAMYEKRRDKMLFFDRDGEKWQTLSITPDEPVGLATRLFFHLRKVRVHVDFKSLGPYEVNELREALKVAVETDDDILTQFHDQKTILKWLDDAKTVGKLFNAYRWFTKEFTPLRGKKKEPEQANSRYGSSLP